MGALSIALASAVEAGAASLPAWRRLLEWYSLKLITNPVATKGFTSMFVNPIGGMVGQIIKDGRVTNWKEIKYFIIWGLGLGPSAHYWNEVLQFFTDKYKWNLVVKLLVDHYIWKEIIIYVFCWYTSYFVGNKPATEIKKWLGENYWKFPSGLFFSSLYVWIPIQVVNLYWVPLPFRVLYMNISVMIWTVYLATKLSGKAVKKD